MKKVRFLLAASLLLALAFTLSCSDDDKGGGWLSCKEFFAHIDRCDDKYEKEYNTCSDDACRDAVDANDTKCILDACNGTSKQECKAHYSSCKED